MSFLVAVASVQVAGGAPSHVGAGAASAILVGCAAFIAAITSATRGEKKAVYLAACALALLGVLTPLIFQVLSFIGGTLILVALLGAIISCAL